MTNEPEIEVEVKEEEVVEQVAVASRRAPIGPGESICLGCEG